MNIEKKIYFLQEYLQREQACGPVSGLDDVSQRQTMRATVYGYLDSLGVDLKSLYTQLQALPHYHRPPRFCGPRRCASCPTWSS